MPLLRTSLMMMPTGAGSAAPGEPLSIDVTLHGRPFDAELQTRGYVDNDRRRIRELAEIEQNGFARIPLENRVDDYPQFGIRFFRHGDAQSSIW